MACGDRDPIVVGEVVLQEVPALLSLRREEPAKSVCDEVDKLITGIVKGKPKTDEGLIEFTSFLGKWRARLSDDEILLLDQKARDLVFARKDEVTLTDNGKATMGKDTKIHLRVGDRQWSGQMPPQYFQRLDSWRQKASEPSRTF